MDVGEGDERTRQLLDARRLLVLATQRQGATLEAWAVASTHLEAAKAHLEALQAHLLVLQAERDEAQANAARLAALVHSIENTLTAPTDPPRPRHAWPAPPASAAVGPG